MNGRQRIEHALEGKYPDKVPVMLHNFLLAIKEAGVSHAQYRENPEIIAKVHIEAVAKYGHDGILLDIDTVTLAGALGVKVDFPEDMPARSHEPLLRSIEEIDDLPEVPDVEKYKYVQILLEAAKILKKTCGGDVYIRGNCDQAPFSLACAMRSPGELMMDLLTEQNLPRVRKLLDYCCEATCQLIRLMAKTGVDMVSNGDSPAGPAMISPGMYREFALPYQKRIVAVAHAEGIKYLMHICGDTNVILDDMVTMGADAYELDYKTDLARIKKDITPKAAFFGNIDPTGILVQASPSAVAEATRNLLSYMKDEPRFVLNAGCAIPAETPPDNLKAMITTARSFIIGAF